MARNYYLVFISVALLSSCAQVGTISGGEVDHSAPKPIVENVQPPNESINFKGGQVEIPFDEFIRLNKPSENIVMVPPHAKIDAVVKGKTLFLEWDESQLQDNTTYAIYLNNAVKDITEGNDTLIQYVFSTGNILDSLSYSTTVLDAWTNQPIEKCIVGLFTTDSNEIVSFGTTNKKGEVTLNYLPRGEFELVAFEDKNNDLEYQSHEKIAFPLISLVSIQESIQDSVALRMYSPVQKPIVSTVKHFAPGAMIIGANHDLTTSKITINELKVGLNHVKQIANDSLMVFFNSSKISTAEVIVSNDQITDTSKIRLSDTQKNSLVNLKCKNSTNQFTPSEDVVFYCNDFIQSIDKSLIEVMNLEDSTMINNFDLSFSYNEIVLELEEKANDFSVDFKEEAIISTHSTVAEQSFKINVLLERQLGVIHLDLSFYDAPVIVQLIKSGKIIAEKFIQNPSEKVSLINLLPGEYSFKIILDENRNGTWDVGNYQNKLQPEKIDYYSTLIKVRANWDVDVTLGK